MRIYSIAKQYPVRVALALVALGLASLSDVAMAQQQPDEVTVVAPREIARSQTGRLGARTEVVSVSQEVSYKDLDLKTPEGAKELNRRVTEAADDGCAELDRLFPMTLSSRLHNQCVRNSVQSTMNQINTAVAAAGR